MGLTQASRVMRELSCSELEFGMLTRLEVPLNDNADPYLPLLDQVVPATVPVLPLPDASVTGVPDPSSNRTPQPDPSEHRWTPSSAGAQRQPQRRQACQSTWITPSRGRLPPAFMPPARPFAQVKASANRSGATASIPRRRINPLNVSRSNQCLSGLVRECRLEEVELPLDHRPRRGDEDVGRPRSPSTFGISYSRIRWFRNVFHVSSQASR